MEQVLSEINKSGVDCIRAEITFTEGRRIAVFNQDGISYVIVEITTDDGLRYFSRLF